jgi:hypothetical protein
MVEDRGVLVKGKCMMIASLSIAASGRKCIFADSCVGAEAV